MERVHCASHSSLNDTMQRWGLSRLTYYTFRNEEWPRGAVYVPELHTEIQNKGVAFVPLFGDDDRAQVPVDVLHWAMREGWHSAYLPLHSGVIPHEPNSGSRRTPYSPVGSTAQIVHPGGTNSRCG